MSHKPSFNITSALDYTVANNPGAVQDLIIKYGMPAPQDAAETLEAARIAIDMHGNKFAHDMAMIHPDIKYLLQEAGHFGKCCSGRKSNLAPDNISYDLEALQAEMIALEQELELHITPSRRQEIADRIEWLKQKIAQLTAPVPPSAPKTETGKDYTPLLAVGLLIIGIVAISRK